jgi:hypothetical protein
MRTARQALEKRMRKEMWLELETRKETWLEL